MSLEASYASSGSQKSTDIERERITPVSENPVGQKCGRYLKSGYRLRYLSYMSRTLVRAGKIPTPRFSGSWCQWKL
jgi:hypothetical protein